MSDMNLTREVRQQLALLPLPGRIVMRLRLAYRMARLRRADRHYTAVYHMGGRQAGRTAAVRAVSDRRAAVSRLVQVLYRKTRGEVPPVLFTTREDR